MNFYNTKILIKNLTVMAKIGVHDFEQKKPQAIRINCEMRLFPHARAGRDDLSDTVCYASVRQKIIDQLTNFSYQLLETAAQDIGQICLIDQRVESVTVTVEKPDIFPDADAVGVSLELCRGM